MTHNQNKPDPDSDELQRSQQAKADLYRAEFVWARPSISPAVGRPPKGGALAAYAKCQYTHTTTPPSTHPDAPVTRVHCTERSIIMPGYYRSCAAHVLQLLRRSLFEYATRNGSAQDDPNTVEHIAKLLDTLNSLDHTLTPTP